MGVDTNTECFLGVKRRKSSEEAIGLPMLRKGGGFVSTIASLPHWLREARRKSSRTHDSRPLHADAVR